MPEDVKAEEEKKKGGLFISAPWIVTAVCLLAIYLVRYSYLGIIVGFILIFLTKKYVNVKNHSKTAQALKIMFWLFVILIVINILNLVLYALLPSFY